MREEERGKEREKERNRARRFWWMLFLFGWNERLCFNVQTTVYFETCLFFSQCYKHQEREKELFVVCCCCVCLCSGGCVPQVSRLEENETNKKNSDVFVFSLFYTQT